MDKELLDESFRPDLTRIVDSAQIAMLEDDRVKMMGEMITTSNGGSIRTFSGKLAHENGWWPSRKRRLLQHWEGKTQRQALLLAECDFTIEWAQSEPCLLRFRIGDAWFEWYADLLVSRYRGPDELWEIKKSDRQLEDPDYLLKLAGAREVCRRMGKRFRLVMADEIAVNRHHRDNVELFASRRFVTIDPKYLGRFENFSIKHGQDTTYGELANIIEPLNPVRGAAIIQGLTVQRRVEIDLRARLSDATPLRIH
ncbi:MAG: hypothetical protein WA908_02205 [Pontixanthobacter sp.]